VCGFIHLFVGWMTMSFINIGNSILFLLLTHTHSCTWPFANSCLCRFDRIMI
jgi:hypothetical protein